MKAIKKPGLTTILMAFTLLISVLLVSLVSMSNYFYMVKRIQRDSAERYKQVFSPADAAIRTTLQDVIRTAALLNTDSELVGAVNLAMNGQNLTLRMQQEKQAQYILKSAAQYQSYVDNVIIYIRDRQFVMYDAESADYCDRVPQEDWFHKLMSKEQESVFVANYPIRKNLSYDAEEPFYKPYCLYAVPFNNTRISQNPGVLLISINQDIFAGLLDSISCGDGSIIALYDKQNRLIYAADEHIERLENATIDFSMYASNDTVPIDGTDYFLIKYPNSLAGWNLAALIPQNIMYQEVAEFQKQIFKFAFIAILLGLLLSVLISRAITSSFKELTDSMNRAGGGDLATKRSVSAIREIDILMEHYARMMERISNLIEQVKVGEKEKRHAEMAALQSQINPHFTYNTLEAIRWVALMQHAPQAAQMISLFVKLLRLTTGQSGDLIEVRQEIAQISCYVEIMKFRYNCQIDVDFTVDEQVTGCRTLKLILQPIVENCFIHGFQNFEGSGRIEITAAAADGRLVFTVRDNGDGMELPPGVLPQASPADKGEHLHKGIGVSNVDERIRLWFGPQYGIHFESFRGRGTLVTITQPLIREQWQGGEKG